MWISRKTSEINDGSIYGGQIGVVSVGGRSPAVLTDGETRTAQLLDNGILYVPKLGDEVLLEKTRDGETVVVGKLSGSVPAGVSDGEICLEARKGSSIHIKNDGSIVISGDIVLTGNTQINGDLKINGLPLPLDL